MNTMITKVMTNKLVKRQLGPNTNTQLVEVCQSDIVREVLADILKDYIFKHPGYHKLVVYLGATRASLFKDVELYGVVYGKSSEDIFMTQQQRDRLRTAIIDVYLSPPPPQPTLTRVVTLEVADEEVLFGYQEGGEDRVVMYYRGDLYSMNPSLGSGYLLDIEAQSANLEAYLNSEDPIVEEGLYRIGSLTLSYKDNLFTRVN